ncbi:MAG: hypothetical protein P4M08_10165 [Oligoflexia bacterium]|nr:hypothetical protein [Oligoflexia bacterium]
MKHPLIWPALALSAWTSLMSPTWAAQRYKWELFSPENGEFTVKFPGSPFFTRQENDTTEAVTYQFGKDGKDGDPVTLAITAFRLKNKKLAFKGTAEGICDGTERDLKSGYGAELHDLKRSEIASGGLKGCQFAYTVKWTYGGRTTQAIARTYVSPAVIYTLTASETAGKNPGIDLHKFLDSFAIKEQSP